MRPRSINIFLLDGDPDGIRIAQISMSTIQAIAFRKLQAYYSAFPFSRIIVAVLVLDFTCRLHFGRWGIAYSALKLQFIQS